jgi:hypothetical protein
MKYRVRKTRWFRTMAVMVLLSSTAFGQGEVDQARELGKFLGKHGYGAVQVDTTNDNQQYLHTLINGHRAYLIIDTGSERTGLMNDRARAIGLDIHDSGHKAWGVGGPTKENSGIALINSFTIDNYEINRTNTITVLPKASRHVGSYSDGLFGYDFLHDNAVILPVGGRFILFKPGNAPVASIDSFMLALGFKPLPLVYGKGGLKVEGELDGQPFTAIVDCGCALSIVDLKLLQKVKESVEFSPIPMTGIDGRRTLGFRFTPKQLAFGPIAFKPVELESSREAIFDALHFDMLLGYDMLASHQAIIDLGTNTLWMK